MAGHDWEAIKDAFADALLLEGEAREHYLADLEQEHPEVVPAARELLRAHLQASVSFLAPDRVMLRVPWLFATGTLVAGRFRIVRAIARGAMGEVYQAHDERLRLDVALKAIRPELLSDPESVERFRREVRVARAITHPNICRVYELVEHQIAPDASMPDGATLPCLTMQLLQGESLESWAESNRPASVERVLPLVREIGSALHALHSAGIVHRDLKPSNVMVVEDTDGFHAVLTDFGLARPLDHGLFETQRTSPGGAPYFMAPELFAGARPSRSSDVYALALLIDELVTTRRAFSAESLHGLLLQKLNDRPEPPSSRAAGLPPHWDEVILQALDPDPAQRLHDARSLVEGLASPASSSPLAASSRRPALRRRLLPLTAAVSLLTGSAVAFTGSRTSPDAMSLVVLPFENRTGSRAHTYLATQAAAGLAKRLERVPGLLVHLARDRTTMPPVEQRAELALTGELRQTGSGLRLTTQITTGGLDRTLWSRQYDFTGAAMLSVEQQVVADALGVINRASRPSTGTWLQRWRRWRGAPLVGAVPSSGTTNAEAYDAYWRARELANERTLEPVLAAKALFERAAALDPDFAAPHAALADLQAVLMELQVAPHADLLRDAETHAAHAVALAPDLPDAQLSLAGVLQMQGQWAAAEQAFKRALELHPKFARAHRWYAGMLLQFNRLPECYELFRKGLELDPYDIPSQSAYGLALFYGRRPADAVQHLESLLARKDFMPGHLVLGQSYAYLGGRASSGRTVYRDKALREATRLFGYDTDASRHYGDLVGGLAWSYFGEPAEAAPYLARLEQSWRSGKSSSSYAARVLAAQGRADEAMEALLDAERHNDRELMYLAVSPHYDALRGRTDFADLLVRLGFTSARRP